jgi:two-component system, LytTR family, sensor histidine kinase AlgZ
LLPGRTHNAMASINQNSASDALPNFCNLGVVLRILVAVNAFALAAAVIRHPDLMGMAIDFVEGLAVIEPVLLLSLMLLCPLRRPLGHFSYAFGVAAVITFELMLATLVWVVAGVLTGEGDLNLLMRYWMFAGSATALLLGYFFLRNRAFSPALAEARLQALQARIRPHFLFNSINAVLSLLRAEPKRAEHALEDMADLFRVLMADNRKLATLAVEIALCRQYLALEELRLGDRLRIKWDIEPDLDQALVPPLVLQPLVENAVYHGIEPSIAPGDIEISVRRVGSQVEAAVRNPYLAADDHHSGNKMALSNIRERLALHFDVEAELKTRVDGDFYEVSIRVPLRYKERVA